MKRFVWFVVVVALLAGCGQAPATPTASPAPAGKSLPPSPIATTPAPVLPSSTAPAAPTATLAVASPLPTPNPAAWWDNTILYEIFVRSFYDGDGDGIGDLPGLIDRLDYLNDGDPATSDDLGVTGLWLMPIFASPSYHGYDVTDYYTVNPEYGTNDDFKRLMDEAHRRGIRVIVDLVLNHTSDQHPWFVDSASGPEAEHRDWYIWSQTDPGYFGPWGETVWHEKNGAYYYGVFGGSMPDLNLQNPNVTAALYDVAHFWLEDMGADGFRLDAARHLIEEGKIQANTPETHAWLHDFYAFTKSVNPEAMTVGEIQDVSDAIATYVGSDMDLAFEFSLAKALLLSVNEERVTPIDAAMHEILRLYPQEGYASFLTNHDQNRVMDVLSGDGDKAKVAATLLLTLPGVPFIYYGEEIGMTGSKPDELIRTPMQWTAGEQAGFTSGTPWEPVNAGYEDTNVEVESADPTSLLNLYRTLVALRSAHPALAGGKFYPLQSTGRSVYAFLRSTPGDQVLAVINLGAKPAVYVLSLAESALLPGGYRVTDLLSGSEVPPLIVGPSGAVGSYQPVPELPARSALILRLLRSHVHTAPRPGAKRKARTNSAVATSTTAAPEATLT
jgi:alpha-amylase